MKTTSVNFDPIGTLDSTAALLKKISTQDSASVLILSCDGNQITPDEWKKLLPHFPFVFFGGIFPQVIFSDRHFEKGTVVVGFDTKVNLARVGGLNDADAGLDAQILSQIPFLKDAQSMLIWVDGLSQRIAQLLESVYDNLGGRKTYMGGGAGSLSFQAKPCVFFNQTLLQGEAVLVPLPSGVHVGVEHGWQKFAGPFNVTSSQKNCIRAIDYKDAFQIYRKTVVAPPNVTLCRENFFEMAKGFPFGIENVDGSLVVRDPIITDEKTLTCVGEVPENSIVYILKGDKETLVKAAKLASEKAAVGGNFEICLVVDCISRVLFLESEFEKEIDAANKVFSESKTPLVGVLSLGEIANDGGRALQFYNKTFVIGAFRAV